MRLRHGSHVVRRGAALLVAFVLTGALPVAHSFAGEHEHRCGCRHAAGEACGCSSCRRAAAKARRDRADAHASSRCHQAPGAPPCHGPAAPAASPGEAPELPAGVAVVRGCCGVPEQPGATLQAPDPFVPPAGPALGPVSPRRSSLASALAAPPEVPRAPPTPPPRAA